MRAAGYTRARHARCARSRRMVVRLPPRGGIFCLFISIKFPMVYISYNISYTYIICMCIMMYVYVYGRKIEQYCIVRFYLRQMTNQNKTSETRKRTMQL